MAKLTKLVLLSLVALQGSVVYAQDLLPRDNTIFEYHNAPRYRESESHPLRVAAYVLHPIGWLAKEAIFRPISYFAGSSNTRKVIMGFREPNDYRRPDCFGSGDGYMDCRKILPFNYKGSSMIFDDDNGASQDGRGEDITGTDLSFPKINFAFNSYALSETGKRYVDEIATILKEKENMEADSSYYNIVIEGHADDVGTEDYNLKLAEKRALTVRKALEAQGVDGSRLRTISYGESMPLVEGTSSEARDANRRVEVKGDK